MDLTKDVFKGWTTLDYVKNIPPIVSALMVSFVAVAFLGDTSLLAVTTLFAIIVGAAPYFLYNYFRVKHVRDMEDQIPNFLRDLVEALKSGMNLSTAIEQATHADYGRLTPEIKKMHYQMTWGVPFDESLLAFAKRVKESDLINRSVRIIIEARKSGGDVAAIMETIASDAAIIKEAEKERKAKTSQQVFIMYLIYFMFIVIVISLTRVLAPIGELSGLTAGGAATLGVTAGGPCAGVTGGATGAVCGFFDALARVFGLGTGIESYYRALFMSMIVVQGIFSGLIAGQIGEDSVFAGVKHSMILTSLGFAIFILAFKLGFA
ncbi:MAG: type II secretion system F family protein [Candidatus Aenigmatarchaeota archaeon]|nr:MAG: type II secretion system F family protein [Candidatus Aenigmarchaeota archaeon]